jgi:hypothetical protein
MGESGRDALRVGFDGSLKLEFHGSKITSDAGFGTVWRAPQGLGRPEIRLVETQKPGRIVNIADGGRGRRSHLGNIGLRDR